MKILTLTLENFRQFLGSQTIEFATDDTRNVTLIWGANGAGKTTLLNAFTWALYGTFTGDFEHPERLANESLWEELQVGTSATVRVELEFEHDDLIYRLARWSTFRKEPDGRATPIDDRSARLDYTDQDGKNHPQANPNEAVKWILPDRLHGFFFFNGERIEHLVQPSAYEEIGDAIRTVLGLEVVERALRHLPQASKKLEEELRAFGTDEQRTISGEIDRLDDVINGLEQEGEETRKNAAGVEEEITALDAKLRSQEGAVELTRRRDDLNRDGQRNTARLESVRRQLDGLIRDRGFLAFTGELFEKTRANFSERRVKGEIPTPIKREFIKDLLDQGQCICGTPLVEGTPPHQAISEWRMRAGMMEVDDAWHAIYAEAGSMLESRALLSHELARLVEEREETRAEKRRLEEALSEVSQQLGSSVIEDVRALEDTRADRVRQLKDLERQLGRLQERLETANTQLAEQRSRLRKAESQNEKAELARRRVSVTQDAIELLRRVHELRVQDVRRDLDKRIRDVYQRISYKPYIPILTEQFQLELRHDDADGLAVAKSTGENQILSLSFVGALAGLARERYEESQRSSGLAATTGAAGGVFPIVMDAAFGTLDERYQREVAQGLPLLAPQVIILVSKSQGLGAVEEHLRGRVGRSHVIHYLTTKELAAGEVLELDHQRYPYIDVANDGRERAELLSL